MRITTVLYFVCNSNPIKNDQVGKLLVSFARHPCSLEEHQPVNKAVIISTI